MGITEVKGQLLIKTFRVDVVLKGKLGPLPGIGELSAGELQPLMCLRLVRDPGAIYAKGFSFKKAGQGLVQRSGICKTSSSVNIGAGAKESAAVEILVELTLNTKAKPETRTIAIGAVDTQTTRVSLKDSVVAKANVSGEAKTSVPGRILFQRFSSGLPARKARYWWHCSSCRPHHLVAW